MSEEEKLERLEICRQLIELREQLGDIVFEDGPAPEKADGPMNAVFTMELEPELLADFMVEAEASHRPASQVVREFMHSFVEQQRAQRENDAFLQAKVEAARTSMREGRGRTNEEVEAALPLRAASRNGCATPK